MNLPRCPPWKSDAFSSVNRMETILGNLGKPEDDTVISPLLRIFSIIRDMVTWVDADQPKDLSI